ncbi:hypothetical protein LX32DRAFT_141095 [Colletotrichum zoysiae]|uniref:Uncharacterized protein n=1 Tax=Colletotrichum zoysiae TaxID=1216348 RepID=A0AAD9H7A8_9PEZI|nr:hypothetical protein LX32DRAFT_141095 [Colletotrichum zoysiae]
MSRKDTWDRQRGPQPRKRLSPPPHPCGEARIHAQAIFPVASLTLPSLLTLPPVLTSYALVCCDICAVARVWVPVRTSHSEQSSHAVRQEAKGRAPFFIRRSGSYSHWKEVVGVV